MREAFEIGAAVLFMILLAAIVGHAIGCTLGALIS